MRTNQLTAHWILLLALSFAACVDPTTDPKFPTPVNAASHRWFPLTAGTTHEFGKVVDVDGAITCDSCHRPTADSFKAVKCDQCHKHTERITQRLHLGIPSSFNVDTSAVTDPDLKAELRGANCVSCHPTGERRAFSHTLITGECSECHAASNAFAALPKANFTHPDVGAADCGGCHVTSTWEGAGLAPSDVSDPSRDLSVTGLMPTFTATSITRVTALQQTLPMPMNHLSMSVDAGVLSNCGVCHVDAATGTFFPGQLHWSLSDIGQPQPARCAECHTRTQPQGLVGPTATNPARTPATGEMRHDAVAWMNGAPTATKVVTEDCAVCHRPPDENGLTTWEASQIDGGPARFHASLTAGGKAQPASCTDCHANSRPVVLLTSSNATLRAGMSFDHQSGNALAADCTTCHTSTSTWAGGSFHAGSPTPATCLPCHASERPTTTTGWTSTTYQQSPFDYGTNTAGVTHGAGEDCAVCHSTTTQTWVGGHFPHGAGTVATSTCIACHLSQRPTAAVPAVAPFTTMPFDHSVNGTGDCRACHQETVRVGAYVRATPLPGSDWTGGREYPGDVLATSQTQFVALTAYTLTRSPTNFVTGITSQSLNLYNAMLHTSAAVPAQVFPGPANAPVSTSCWHCHTHTAGTTTVTSYADGKFHSALTNYTLNPTGTPGSSPLTQPTSCKDCHEQMRPNVIVEKAASPLQPMDHSATFTAAINIGGQNVTGVAQLDCVTCHKTTPGTAWNDGKFHANIGAAVPSNCVNCHYPMSIVAAADVTSSPVATTFVMKHRSPSLSTLQKCETCHTTALAAGATTPIAATLWKTGNYHGHVTPTQPTACLECHSNSEPAAATQGTVVYALTQGGTATNGAQWMNHLVADVTSRDCAFCHGADAKASGAAWNRATSYHAKVTAPAACSICHGTGNGRGTTVGTNNNLPSGLTTTRTTTTASPFPGVKDQLIHTDLNVTGHDCNFCHTQKGTSTTAGVQGVEWKQVTFHNKFTAAAPLTINGTTARCSNCHLNVKPGTTYTQQDHSGFTATSTQDCSSCHAYPGTSAAMPNWLGATGAHASSGTTSASALDCNSCHGLNGSSSKHLAVAASAHYGGITNGNKCISCHIDFTGFKDTITNLKYAHSNATANAGSCVACHTFKASTYTTLTNTPGLTHPTVAGGHQFSQTFAVTGSFNGDSFNSNHSATKLTLCGSCHQYTTTTAALNVWTFKHRPSNPGVTNSKSTSGCNNCH